MTRRRPVLAALAVAALGAAWWLSTDGLSAEERRLVGTWWLAVPAAVGSGVWTFGADGRCHVERAGPPSQSGNWTVCVDGNWFIRGGTMVFDYEPSWPRRAVRPLGRLLGLRASATAYPAAWTDPDRIVLTAAYGTREEWDRSPPDR